MTFSEEIQKHTFKVMKELADYEERLARTAYFLTEPEHRFQLTWLSTTWESLGQPRAIGCTLRELPTDGL